VFFRDQYQAIKNRDPAFRSPAEILFYASFWALLLHKLAHGLYNLRLYVLARLVSQLSRFLTQIEIHPGAKIGRRLFMDHGAAVVIGETAEIGEDVLMYQGVTLGGTGKGKGKRHPTLEDHVLVGAGAKILGGITIGEGSRIGAGSVVLDDIPPHSTVVGIPGKVVRVKGQDKQTDVTDQYIETLEHRFPDPVNKEICELRARVEALEQALKNKENTKDA